MKYKLFILFLILPLFIFGINTRVVHAQSDPTNPAISNPIPNLTYTQLEPLPGQNLTNANFCYLINYLFKLLIYLGGMIAVLFLVLGGITYMTSEVVHKRLIARERVEAALWGLLLLLCSWIILNAINPKLVSACNILAPSTAIGAPSAPPTLSGQQQRAQQCSQAGYTYKVLNPDQSCSTFSPNCGGTVLGMTLPGFLSVVACCANMAPGEICLGTGWINQN